MQSLQKAYTVLTDIGACPIMHSRTKILPDGKISYADVRSISLYVPVNLLGPVMTKINDVLPGGYKIVYWPYIERLHIEPGNFKFQFICNTIYSCNTVDQLDSAGRMIDTHFKDEPYLCHLLTLRYKIFKQV